MDSKILLKMYLRHTFFPEHFFWRVHIAREQREVQNARTITLSHVITELVLFFLQYFAYSELISKNTNGELNETLHSYRGQ